jgi:acyl-phosphate glycerol 3-phosphate acyltransferase
MALLIAVIAGYLIGSISFAVVVSRAMGLDDPRSYGSGNPGATNVLRSGNRQAALLTLAGDALKGAVAVWLARAFAGSLGVDPGAAAVGVALVGLAAFIGHLYPVFHGFAGGKGVATAAGVLLALSPLHGLATMATWLVIAFFFRCPGGGRVRPALLGLPVRGRADGLAGRRDERAAGLATPRQHREAAARRGKPHRRQARAGGTGRRILARRSGAA